MPQHGEERDIFERLYAVRLDRLRSSPECREVLRGRDSRGLLGNAAGEGPGAVREDTSKYEAGAVATDSLPSDDELVSALRGESSPDITQLKHVRPREVVEEVAQRNPCKDFGVFRPLFENVQRELETGERQTLKYKDNADVKKGDLFILDG